MAAATEAFLDGTGLGPGWACLDVGCGDGQVTIHLARAAAPDGRAAGAATGDEVDALRAGVEAAARDPDRVFFQAVMHQVRGTRPRASPSGPATV